MSQDLWTEVDNYIGGELIHEDHDLTAALRANAEAALPAHDVSPWSFPDFPDRLLM